MGYEEDKLKIIDILVEKGGLRGLNTQEITDKIGLPRKQVTEYLCVLEAENKIKSTQTNPQKFYVGLIKIRGRSGLIDRKVS